MIATHVTFNSLVALSTGTKPELLPEEFDASMWHRACDWRQVPDMHAMFGAAEVINEHRRPTCPECCVYLDVALEMAP